MSTIAKRVDKGFNSFTREQRDIVDPDTLNMMDGLKCMLGQIYGYFGYGEREHFMSGARHLTMDERNTVSALSIEHGFDTHYPDEYASLTNEWRRRLLAERENVNG